MHQLFVNSPANLLFVFISKNCEEWWLFQPEIDQKFGELGDASV